MADAKLKTRMEMRDGKPVRVVVCPPSKRRASSSVQRKAIVCKPARGAWHVAKEEDE